MLIFLVMVFLWALTPPTYVQALPENTKSASSHELGQTLRPRKDTLRDPQGERISPRGPITLEERAFRMRIEELTSKLILISDAKQRHSIVLERKELIKNHFLYKPELLHEKDSIPSKANSFEKRKGLIDRKKPEQSSLSSRVGSELAPLQIQVNVSQIVYHIPFGTQGNMIQLTVVNSSQRAVSNVCVQPIDIPIWLHISPGEQLISRLESNCDSTVGFTLAVDLTSPVVNEQKIPFAVKIGTSDRWLKYVRATVDGPTHSVLYQNYPNPLNPQTTISYVLVGETYVTLNVYNQIGEEILSLVNGVQGPGYQAVNFDGGELPSGVYFYRLRAGNFVDVKKMILMR